MEEQPERPKKKLHPNSIANLELGKWQPGQSGNPTGRPKRKPITDIMLEEISKPEFQEAFRAALRRNLTKGGVAFVLLAKEMADRLEGKVTQPVDLEVNVGLGERLKRAAERAGE